MLVLSRKKGQSVILQENIEITVLEVEGDVIKLGIAAPREIQILRKELVDSVQESNRNAVSNKVDVSFLSEELKKISKNF
ncbi:carbon storage regulator [Cohnella sp. CIP 111063]|uniref:carbon storage regulator CsrA n=1 Tax=unclassified Cohnella TaxID=2636738 RepID=UPI000B8C587B|nr:MULTISPECIES: carbon storage regulator CsrA [unclassified Cohnella]OXS55895.1 carbon storage regulator [Cohnella sp. CIP 111063]PRX67097.1 carbon storage regulator CsrA [Cohnella sp. SGD-V74]